MNIAFLALSCALAIGTTTLAHSPSSAQPLHEGSAATTTLTLRMSQCDGCTVGLVSASVDDYEDVWSAKARKVEDGTVRFAVPTERTRNLSINLTAPWEGNTGYRTQVALRYNGAGVGATVDKALARTRKRASLCWAGTSEPAAKFVVKTKKVRVDGNGGRVWGTLAFARTTPEWIGPMVPVYGGVAGAQDVPFCGES